ncbi:MAG: hypothetical protein A2Y33_15250 [Spirochaetes bacterium GWF1_51_8]|nr:MAG: hypothetical protein A2Y33_15250 [Spirochaetes bacterium GWF1_51_8]
MKGLLKGLLFAVVAVLFASCVQEVKMIEWSANAKEYQAKIGQKFTFEVKGGGMGGSVWGTDIYTLDSSLATAAVHAGIITFDKGGKFTIEIKAGEQNYTGSERNGVTSQSWGSYAGSYVFVK